MAASLVYSIRYLRTNNLDFDLKAEQCSYTGVFLGILGLLTGSVWRR